MTPLELLAELKKDVVVLKDNPDCADIREGIIVAAIDKAFDLGRREQAERKKKRLRQHFRVAYISREYNARSKDDIIDYYKKDGAAAIGRAMLDDGAINIEMDPDESNENVVLKLSVMTVAPDEGKE